MSIAALVLGVAATLGGWPVLAPMLSAGGFERTNRRGRTVVTAAGIVIVLAALSASAAVALLDAAGLDPLPERRDVALSLVAVLGFGVLGLLDDILPRTRGGMRGHLGALSRGEVTPGLVKLAGGAAVGVVVASSVSTSFVAVVRDGAVIALAANLANLLDLAPGRTTKIATLVWLALTVAAGIGSDMTPSAFVVGAGLGLLVPEMRERCMLGDTGSNVLGAVLGVAAVLVAPAWSLWVVLGALIALTLASEVVSFSRVIGSVRWLRALDELGFRPPRHPAP